MEQSTAVVVEEEHSLHSYNASKEKGVRDGACTEGLAGVVKVAAEAHPETNQTRQCEEHCEHERMRDELGGRFRVRLEDVVDLRL